MTLWQWMSVHHARRYAIWNNLGLIDRRACGARVPARADAADTIKFFYIFALLLVICGSAAMRRGSTTRAAGCVRDCVPVRAGAGFCVAAVVPLVPDLRFVIEQVLTVVMFLSGVIFALDQVPSPLRVVFELNPVVTLLDATRGILMRGEWPNWFALLKIGLISAVVCAFGLFIVQRLAPRYPKLAI